MQRLSVPQGEFSLARYPLRSNETLRAWDAADEYVLNHLAHVSVLQTNARVLILNDSFGALSVALAEYRPELVSDSLLAHAGTQANLSANELDQHSVILRSSIEPLSRIYDVVILKITKSMALLEDQLHRLRPHLSDQSVFIAAAMVKGIHSSTLKLFERVIGPTKTSLARKKARLVFAQFDPELEPGANPFPKYYDLEATDDRLLNHSGVFSREKLDIGTRFFVSQLPANNKVQTIVDLGCGNGAVGMMAAHKNPAAELIFVDESFMAVDAAKQNFHAAFAELRTARFEVMDCLSGIEPASADVVLNNPPFHQQTVVGDHIARQMFAESSRVLKTGGELWVVGNRHLGYHVRLKGLFGNCELVASNQKFVVLRAIKR